MATTTTMIMIIMMMMMMMKRHSSNSNTNSNIVGRNKTTETGTVLVSNTIATYTAS